MTHYRQPYVANDPQCRKEIFECLKELKCEDGFDIEALPTQLLEYFENLSLEEATRLTSEWQRNYQGMLESFGIW